MVPQHHLNTFLASAEDLEILGLSKKCANIHIGADLDEYDLGPLELPSRRNKRLKRKRAAAAAHEGYEEPEIKQENSGLDEARAMMCCYLYGMLQICSCHEAFSRRIKAWNALQNFSPLDIKQTNRKY